LNFTKKSSELFCTPNIFSTNKRIIFNNSCKINCVATLLQFYLAEGGYSYDAMTLQQYKYIANTLRNLFAILQRCNNMFAIILQSFCAVWIRKEMFYQF